MALAMARTAWSERSVGVSSGAAGFWRASNVLILLMGTLRRVDDRLELRWWNSNAPRPQAFLQGCRRLRRGSLGFDLAAGLEGEALVGPAGHAAQHHLHRPAKARKLQRRPVRAVAMRTGAVDDEQRIVRPGH